MNFFTLENLAKLLDFIYRLFGRNKRKEQNNKEVDGAFKTGDASGINERISK